LCFLINDTLNEKLIVLFLFLPSLMFAVGTIGGTTGAAGAVVVLEELSVSMKIADATTIFMLIYPLVHKFMIC
jgi:hypothetical protein